MTLAKRHFYATSERVLSTLAGIGVRDRLSLEVERESTGCTLSLDADPSVFDEIAKRIDAWFGATPAKSCITRRFRASSERVFDAWLDPKAIGRWFGPGLGHMTRIDVDARVGGRFSWVQRRGADDVDHIGEYVEIDRPRRLVFTWGVLPDAPDSRVVIDIERRDDGCELALAHEMPPEWAEFARRGAEAWLKMTAAMDASFS